MEPQAQDPEDLLERARAGDPAAYSALVARHSARLLERIRLMLGPQARRRAESGDFLQDALVRMYERTSPEKFRDERSFLNWLTKVARNLIADELRAQGVGPTDSLLSDSQLQQVMDPSGVTPGRQAEMEEQIQLALECMEELPPLELALIELREIKGLAYGEIAAQLSLSVSQVRTAHVNAVHKLGRSLRRHMD